jgi:hypothetical protein
VYESDDFGGRYLNLAGDSSYLDFNDKTSSVNVSKLRACERESQDFCPKNKVICCDNSDCCINTCTCGNDMWTCVEKGKFVCRQRLTPVGDVNNDCVVDQKDLDLCGEHKDTNWPPCDWNNDGKVDITDLTTVSLNIGKKC